MANRIYFFENALFLDSMPIPFVAGTLEARMKGDQVEIRRVGSEFVFQTPHWSTIARQDGATFDAPSAVLAYLQGEFGKRRPLGIPVASVVAAGDLPAGAPVCISRLDGTMQAARADTYAQAFVVGLLAAPVAAGFIGTATSDALTLDDWTAVVGASALLVGQPYFLGLAGGLTTTPDLTPGNCLVRIGNATGPQTFAPVQSDPILL